MLKLYSALTFLLNLAEDMIFLPLLMMAELERPPAAFKVLELGLSLLAALSSRFLLLFWLLLLLFSIR